MKRLDKDQLKQRSDIVDRLNEGKAEIEKAIEAANAAIEKYNGVLEDARTLRDEWTAEMEAYFDERSEKWQESDTGSAYHDWRNEYENLDLDDISTLDVPDMGHADEFEGIDEQP